ncbi:hypothetical protein B296_00029712, partial [Ensete ventricosum]
MLRVNKDPPNSRSSERNRLIQLQKTTVRGNLSRICPTGTCSGSRACSPSSPVSNPQPNPSCTPPPPGPPPPPTEPSIPRQTLRPARSYSAEARLRHHLCLDPDAPRARRRRSLRETNGGRSTNKEEENTKRSKGERSDLENGGDSRAAVERSRLDVLDLVLPLPFPQPHGGPP